MLKMENNFILHFYLVLWIKEFKAFYHLIVLRI